MIKTKKARHFYEFGDFRIDPVRRQILRGNRPVAVQPKAFDILLVLVENPEKVVLKDDLMKTVWPDTFVEEANLSQHIFMLRKLLSDTPEEKRYIVTVPGRGYRFAEQVRVVVQDEVAESGAVSGEIVAETKPIAADGSELVVESHSRSRLVVEERQLPVAAQSLPATSRRVPWVVASVAVLIVVAAAATIIIINGNLRGHPTLTEKDTVVLADFANRTGDSVFNGALRLGFSAQLEQSPFLNLLSDSRTAQTLALMGRAKDTPLTPELAREVCQRTASAAVLDGSIAQIGNRYLLTMRATACSTGDSIANAEAEANDKNHVLDALGKVAGAIRAKLGESLASVQKYDVPPENVSTSSLEALHSYSLAMQARNGNFTECIPLFERSIEQDPHFAMAYAQLGVVYINMGEGLRGAENLRKAYDLRDHVSEHEKFYIASHYDHWVSGDLEAARKDYELWAQLYPRDYGPFGGLNTAYLLLGDYAKVLSLTQRAVAPNLGGRGEHFPNPNLVWSYIFVNRLDEARTMALQAQAQHVDDPSFHLTLYVIDFLQHDMVGMKREADGLADNPTWGDAVFYEEADTAAYAGQFRLARSFARRASVSAQKAGKKQDAGIYEADDAIREALVGNADFAKQQAKTALALSHAKDVEAMSALALSLAGDSVASLRLAGDLNSRFPQDTVIQFNYLPTIRASAEIHGRVPGQLQPTVAQKAIKILEPVSPYELGTTALVAGISLYPIYVRGDAYLIAKQGAAAAAEFQKIVDHPGVVQNELIGALAHLKLGKAYILSGNKDEAKQQYQQFFSLWKDADPEIPMLEQAKAEYAKLQ